MKIEKYPNLTHFCLFVLWLFASRICLVECMVLEERWVIIVDDIDAGWVPSYRLCANLWQREGG